MPDALHLYTLLTLNAHTLVGALCFAFTDLFSCRIPTIESLIEPEICVGMIGYKSDTSNHGYTKGYIIANSIRLV
jgi:hypothetical protein